MKTNLYYPLQSLFWEATLRCNAYCEFCGSRCGETSGTLLKKEEVDADTVCRCFAEIAKRYQPDEIMINVTGGEPLLREDVFEVMGYASSLGFPWGMVTNGSLITAETVHKMKRSGMRTISISLDGMPETHGRLRKIKDGFSKIENAVKLLKQENFLDMIQITTVVNRKNIDEMEELYGCLLRWEVDSWRLAMVDPIGRAGGQEDLLLQKQDIEKYFAFFDIHQFNGKVALTTSCSHFLGGKDNLYRTHSFSCNTGKTVASILANGDIYVCPNVTRVPELVQGNIREGSFCDVWENGFGWFRNEERQKSVSCEGCEYWDRCRGDSLHTWDFEGKTPRFCFRQTKEKLEERTGKNAGKKKDFIGSFRKIYPKLKGIKISYQSSSSRRVILTPTASEELYSFFAWGKRHPGNIYERMAGLAGHIDGDDIVVEFIIPGWLEQRGEKEAAFSVKSYENLMDEVAIANKCRGSVSEEYNLFSGEYLLLGIAHTHPNGLSAGMSQPDMELHQEMRHRHPDFVSLIVNPHKKELCAFVDSVYSPADVVVLISDNHGNQSGKIFCSQSVPPRREKAGGD